MNNKFKAILKPHWNFLVEFTKPLRRWFFRLLQSLPVSSQVIGPPKGSYESTWDWIVEQGSGEPMLQETTYIKICPSHQISRSQPKTLEQDIHWKFKQEYRRESPATFVAVVPNGRVWGDSGTVITPDDKVLADVSEEHGRKVPDTHSIFFQSKLPAVYQVDGTVAVLSAAGSGGYFHWMFDVLPRVELIRRSGISLDSIDKFVVNSYQLPFQKETLTTLGIPETKIIESHRYPHVKAARLVVPSLPGNTGNMPYWVCDFLRKEFLTSEVVKKFDRPERIYVSRKDTSHRRIINEASLTDFLSKLGFVHVELASMSMAEKAALFSSAKVVVAPHGAGLSNTVFCKEGTKVIELFSPKWVAACFWALSNQMGLEHYYLLGRGKRPTEYTDPGCILADILVDLDELSNIMKLAGIDRKVLALS